MDFTAVILFLMIYYIRPQEWIGAIATIRPAQLVMIFGLLALFFRDKPLRFRDLLRTPHDWAIIAFLVWLIFFSFGGTVSEKWGMTRGLLVFYIVIVQALNTMDRIERFLQWWVVMILVVSALAVLSMYGFDPTGGHDLTIAYKNRLALGSSIFNNPNSLGHGVLPVVPLLYFLAVWKRPIFVKEMALLLFPVPLYCLFLTQSKGSYVSGAATLFLAMLFGRHWSVKILFIVLFMVFGVQLIYSLPRMGELQKGDVKAEGGIKGRVYAWKTGYKAFQAYPRGVGFQTFDKFTAREGKWQMSSHSSFVMIGTELGKTGLFLCLGVLYCCLRTIMTAQCETVQEERIRRLVFTLVIAYIFSSFMVDFAYRATYFMQAAVVAAFHRILIERGVRREGALATAAPGTRADPPDGEPSNPASSPFGGTSQPYPVAVLRSEGGSDGQGNDAGAPRSPEFGGGDGPVPETAGAQTTPRGIRWNWNRIGIIDIALTYVFFEIVVRVWRYGAFRL